MEFNMEAFRRKYGTYSARLEEEFAFIIADNLHYMSNDCLTKCDDFYFTMNNREYAEQFMDYCMATGKYNDMFFLFAPSGTFFYAFDEQQKQNIIKRLSGLAEEYRSKADELDSLLANVRGDQV